MGEYPFSSGDSISLMIMHIEGNTQRFVEMLFRQETDFVRMTRRGVVEMFVCLKVFLVCCGSRRLLRMG